MSTEVDEAPGTSGSAKPAETWLTVARLLKPQGRRGELLAEPLTDLPNLFSKDHDFRFAQGDSTVPGDATIAIEGSWEPQGRNAGRVVLKLAGVDSISAAEALEGRTLLLRQAALPPLDADTYFVRDLVGCELCDGDQSLGTVTDLQYAIGSDGRTRLSDVADLLVVQAKDALPDAEPFLVPFVKAWLVSVDLPAKRIVMQLPAGLLAEG